MKHKMLTMALAALAISSFTYAADFNRKEPTTYNYQRGKEAVDEGDTEKAIEFLSKEVAENPKSGYGHAWLSTMLMNEGEFGRGLTEANLAIKHLPKEDVEFTSAMYYNRSNVNLNMGDTLAAINDAGMAININPEEEEYFNHRAQIYYEQGNFRMSDADYRALINLNEGSVIGYAGLGRNYMMQEQYKEAIDQFTRALKLDNTYSNGYGFRAHCYVGLKDWNKASDDIVSSLILEEGDLVSSLIACAEPAFARVLEAKFKVQAAKAPNDNKWLYLLSALAYFNNRTEDALNYMLKVNEIEEAPDALKKIALYYNELGDIANALKSIDRAIELDEGVAYETGSYYRIVRSEYMLYAGRVDDAIADASTYIEQNPELVSPYVCRAMYYRNAGRHDKAIEDMTMALSLEPDNAAYYVVRGTSYKKIGEKALAEADFNKALEIEADNVADNSAYAYAHLGDREKAIAAMDTCLNANPDNTTTLYDAACVHSIVGNKSEAIEYLKKAFEAGYRPVHRVDFDSDFDNVRNTAEFKAAVDPYRFKGEAVDAKGKNQPAGKLVTTEVPFTKESGITKVKCTINGLPLSFYFDTGAASVTISQMEASFMLKNGYLSNKDISGSAGFVDATGTINVGTVINLKKVDFGGFELTNVRASVVENQVAPLLLGQSVLSRLGKIEIDNARQVIKITHRK